MIKNIWPFRSKKLAITKEELIDADICPNCWGKQEYQDQFADYVSDSTLSNTLHVKEKRKAFIQQFVEDRVSGIQLRRDGNRSVCKACQSGYKINNN